MRKISLLLLLISSVFFVSCHKDDNGGTEPPRDYKQQYSGTDSLDIETYLDTHSMTVSADYDVTFDTITAGNPTSIREQTDYPLQSKVVMDTVRNIPYKLYYISLREGVNRQPSQVDSVAVAYKGVLANRESTSFEVQTTPEWFTLDNVIRGWSEVISLFKTGNYNDLGGPDPVSFTDFGAGVIFIPSGLAYYNQSAGSIPAYSNLVFNFKLCELRWRDHDRDGILSKDEVGNAGDDPKGYDSDGDGTPNYRDVDDDGDHVLTKDEIHKDGSGNIIFEDCDGDGIPNYLDPDSNGATCN
jgi:FKBP-type peptidyl-prolyl cis-trans isomerase